MEIGQTPARHPQKGHEFPGRPPGLPFQAFPDLFDNLRRRLAAGKEKRRLTDHDDLGSGEKGRDAKLRAEPVHVHLLRRHEKEIERPICLGNQGVDDPVQGLADEERLPPEEIGRGDPSPLNFPENPVNVGLETLIVRIHQRSPSIRSISYRARRSLASRCGKVSMRPLPLTSHHHQPKR